MRAAALAVAFVAVLYGKGLIYPAAPTPSDPAVALLSTRFAAAIAVSPGLELSSRGVLCRDRDTTFWSFFTDKFGSNPNTPYMWNALPLMGFGLPSPMWNLGQRDAVVLLSRLPPSAEYFSFTSFALFMPGRGLPFASLGDSVNNKNIRHTPDGLFAHVVTGNRRTAALVRAALTASGVPQDAINLVPVPDGLGLFNDTLHLGGQLRLGTYFETVLRIFRFHNQTEGDAYLRSHPPVFYLRGIHREATALEAAGYSSRADPLSTNESSPAMENDFDAHGQRALAGVSKVFHKNVIPSAVVPFKPLMIRGLDCLKSETDECLGDCPDAAYFGPHIHEDNDRIEMLQLTSDEDLHILTVVDHRGLGAGTYGSIAVLSPGGWGPQPTVSKTKMNIRSTSLGVTSYDFPADALAAAVAGERGPFITWAFTRNQAHCSRLLEAKAVDGCSVITDQHVNRDGHLTYCERIYLNPITSTGPDWRAILPARLYQISLSELSPLDGPTLSEQLFSRMTLPKAIKVLKYPGQPLRFLHIVKTGGESLQGYLDSATSPAYDFSTCRASAMASASEIPESIDSGCLAWANIVSTALCGLNCECCAADIRLPGGDGLHGTLLRSPRAHALSLFSHGHIAHHSSWSRMIADISLYLAEGVLRATENACGSFSTGASADWRTALEERLLGKDPADAVEEKRPLRVLPLENTQAHALTCTKSKGSLGHHFRVLGTVEAPGPDRLAPGIDEAVAAMEKMEWVGVTDLFEPSLCLLHYQANGTIPPVCICGSSARASRAHPLGHWIESRSKKRKADELGPELLAKLDAKTAVDAQLFAAAIRRLIARLRWVEEAEGIELLRCIDWMTLRRETGYIRELWDEGKAGSLLHR